MNELGIFAKYWRPGAVKTRLARSIGDEPAADVHRRMLLATLQRLQDFQGRRVLCYTPASERAAFEALADDRWHLRPQSAGDLGQRMERYFTAAFAEGATRVVLLGSDTPTLPVEYVHQAFELLDSHEVVLGPSNDGGYYLLGAAGRPPAIFEGIAWGTNRVWEETLARLNTQQVSFAEVPPWYDVDERDDLVRLARELAEITHPTAAERELAAVVQHALKR